MVVHDGPVVGGMRAAHNFARSAVGNWDYEGMDVIVAPSHS